MNEEIKIKKIEPMLVAAIHSLADNPENDGWNKLKAWASKEGIFGNSDHPIFGFNNAVGDKHGYEFWIKVDPNQEPSGEISIKKFEGGEFGVIQCFGVENLSKSWKELINWRQKMGYKIPDERYFEHHTNFEDDGNKIEFDLYLPIET
jgi:DNA gyrase inhibitor GyrI